jgi:hypothetical protein
MGLFFFNTSQLLLLQKLEEKHLVQLLQNQPPRKKGKLEAPMEHENTFFASPISICHGESIG